MPLFAESRGKIFGEILNELVNSTNVTRSSPGSKTRAFIETISKKMGNMYSTFDLNFGQAFLDGAEGRWLDFIGDMMNVQRLGSSAAIVTAFDRNIRFYTNTGTFGDINGTASITISAGTIISTASGGNGIRYRVPISTVLDAASDEAYVSVQALRTGSLQNVGKGQLRFHDFNNYVDSANNSLKVTNDADIITGGDLETDSNYRFRIANQVTAAENANEIAIRIAALSVPGVADVTYIPYYRGIGSFDLLLKSITPTVSDNLISTVQAVVSQKTSAGLVPRVRKPIEVGLSMVGSLYYKRTLSSEEETRILDAVTTNVTEYINGLDIAEDFIVQEALEKVLATSALIKKVGTTSKPFDNLYLFKPSRLEDNKVRSTLIDDYVPDTDERIIVENRYAGGTPILIRSA